ncbi:MAG: hypothetical protein ACRDG4_08045 [Chloroflexota bacterium]
MRMLVMVSNNHMSLRELYTLAAENHGAGWATSFMSGLPTGADSIVSGFDAVVYELGAPTDPARVDEVKVLLRAGAGVLTHVEGRDADARAEQLRAAGAQVIAHPVTMAGVSEALDALASQSRAGTDRKRVGIGERIRRTFTG